MGRCLQLQLAGKLLEPTCSTSQGPCQCGTTCRGVDCFVCIQHELSTTAMIQALHQALQIRLSWGRASEIQSIKGSSMNCVHAAPLTMGVHKPKCKSDAPAGTVDVEVQKLNSCLRWSSPMSVTICQNQSSSCMTKEAVQLCK